jgi:hypothetical protein
MRYLLTMEGSRRQRDKEDVAAEYQCAGYRRLRWNSTHSIDSRRGRVEVVAVVGG